MQLDFSGDGLPEPAFENAVDHDAEGFATVPVCGVPLRLRQHLAVCAKQGNVARGVVDQPFDQRRRLALESLA